MLKGTENSIEISHLSIRFNIPLDKCLNLDEKNALECFPGSSFEEEVSNKWLVILTNQPRVDINDFEHESPIVRESFKKWRQFPTRYESFTYNVC